MQYYRLPNVGILGGVCAAFAYEHGFPVVLVRLVVGAVCLALLFPSLLYLWCWGLYDPDYGVPTDYREQVSLVPDFFGE